MTYSALAACTYTAQVTCQGLANDDMTDEQREALDPNSAEYSMRVLGAKIEIVSRVLYIVVLWLTKAAMLAFCRRLTVSSHFTANVKDHKCMLTSSLSQERLGKYKMRIRIGIVLLATSWLADFLITMLNCRPFPMNWQIYPDPGRMCNPRRNSLHRT